MFRKGTDSRRVEIGVYVAGIAMITLLAGWCTLAVGLTLVSYIDDRVIDGSGKAVSDIATASIPDPIDAPATAVIQPNSTAGAVRPTAAVVPPKPSSDDPQDDPAAAFHRGTPGTFRTYCVRLCDGYYFPISFSTTSDRFDIDAKACTAACGSPTRLFVHNMPGGGPGTMVSIEGLPYKSLKTAFQFRSRYDAQCTCRAQPWEEASKDQHRLYAMTEAARKGNRIAAIEAKQLAAKVENHQRELSAARDKASAAVTRELAALVPKSELKPPSASARKVVNTGTRPSVIQLTASSDTVQAEAPTSRGGFKAVSGSAGRGWRDRVFSDN